MLWLATLLATCLALLSTASASALTTAIGANERLCFYADVDKAGEKIGFYFAVQSGGAFDISFSVSAPSPSVDGKEEKVILDGTRERQGDYVLTANTPGEYAFCFSNDHASLAERLVDFDIMVESEPRREPATKPGQIADHSSALEESIFRLNAQLLGIKRMQKFFHTRENRGFAIVKSTQSKIYWFGILEVLGVVAMAVVQVYILQTFFTKTGRRYRV